MPQLNLTKGHACGVDVLLIDGCPGAAAEDDRKLGLLVRRLCDRRGPVGAEAAYFVDAVAGEARVWCFGPDGAASRASAYGIGIVGRVLLDRRLANEIAVRLADKDERFTVRRSDDSPEGVKRVVVETPPITFTAQPPIITGRSTSVGELVPAFHERRPVTAVAVPEPQLVAIVGRYDEAELIEVGRRVGADGEAFPGCPDVTFLTPLDEQSEVFARTYEYGVGVSRSSAAGVIAARAAYARLGAASPEAPILVRTPGGPVRAALRIEAGTWIPSLETNATLTYSAGLDAELLASPAPVALELQANIEEVMAYAALRSANARALEAAGVRYAAP